MSDEPEKPVTRKEFEDLSALVKQNMEATLWFFNSHEKRCDNYAWNMPPSRGCLSLLIFVIVVLVLIW